MLLRGHEGDKPVHLLSSPDTLRVLLIGFASMDWITAAEFRLLSQPDIFLVVKVLAIRAKFLQPSGYYAMINSTFTSRTTNVFGWVGFYGISTIGGDWMPNPLYIYDKCIRFGLVGFYGISTIVGYLLPNSLYHVYWIYKIWFGWLLKYVNHWRLFNTKSFIYIYIKCIKFG